MAASERNTGRAPGAIICTRRPHPRQQTWTAEASAEAGGPSAFAMTCVPWALQHGPGQHRDPDHCRPPLRPRSHCSPALASPSPSGASRMLGLKSEVSGQAQSIDSRLTRRPALDGTGNNSTNKWSTYGHLEFSSVRLG